MILNSYYSDFCVWGYGLGVVLKHMQNKHTEIRKVRIYTNTVKTSPLTCICN